MYVLNVRLARRNKIKVRPQRAPRPAQQDQGTDSHGIASRVVMLHVLEYDYNYIEFHNCFRLFGWQENVLHVLFFRLHASDLKMHSSNI